MNFLVSLLASPHLLRSALVGIVLFLALNGALVYLLVTGRGTRNGYFTIFPTLIIAFDLFLLFNIFGGILLVVFQGFDVEKAPPLMQLAVNGVAQLTVMFFGVVLVTRWKNQNALSVFRLEGVSETPTIAYLIAVPMMFAAQIIGQALSSLWINLLQLFPDLYNPLKAFEDTMDSSQANLTTAHSLPELFLIVLLIGLVPAIAEESLFRGFTQTNIERSGKGRSRPVVALLLASTIFAAIHGSVFKFPGLLSLGLTLGWVAYRTNNLLVGALAHAMNNGVIGILLYFNPNVFDESKNGTSNLISTDQYDLQTSLLILGYGLAIGALFYVIFSRATQNLTARHNADLEIAHRNILAGRHEESYDHWDNGMDDHDPFTHDSTSSDDNHHRDQSL